MRERLGNIETDIDEMIRTIEELRAIHPNVQLTVSGGEPFTTNWEDLKKLFKYIYSIDDRFGVISNGTLVDESWVPFFQNHNGSITISFDGPSDMNGNRGSKEVTDRVFGIIELFRRELIDVQISVVLNDYNLSNIEQLFEWIDKLGSMGIRLGCLQCLRSPEIDIEKTSLVWERLAELVFTTDWCMYEPIVGVVDMFSGRVNRWCYRNPCDPYSTHTIIDVFGDGSYSSCIFSQMDNPEMMGHQEQSFERCHSLYWTSQSEGGCRDCEWWDCCYGGCPANAQDPRKRDPVCGAYKRLFRKVWNLMSEKGMDPKMPPRVPQFDPLMTEPVDRVIPHATGRIMTTVVNDIEMIEDGRTVRMLYDPKVQY